jgi:hypothetical protein
VGVLNQEYPHFARSGCEALLSERPKDQSSEPCDRMSLLGVSIPSQMIRKVDDLLNRNAPVVGFSCVQGHLTQPRWGMGPNGCLLDQSRCALAQACHTP